MEMNEQTITTVLATTALVVSVIALLVTLAAARRQHFYAYEQCRTVVGEDGRERDSWSFSAGYANTLIGQTIGRLYIAVAEAQFRRRQRRRGADRDSV